MAELAELTMDHLQEKVGELHSRKTTFLAEHEAALRPIRAEMDRRIRQKDLERQLGGLSDADKKIAAELLKAGDV